MKYFDTRTHGEVLSRFTNDIDTLAQTLNQSLTQIITSVTTLVGSIYNDVIYKCGNDISALLVIPISLFIITFIIKRSQKYFKNQQEFLGQVNGQVEELYGGHILFKHLMEKKMP